MSIGVEFRGTVAREIWSTRFEKMLGLHAEALIRSPGWLFIYSCPLDRPFYR